MLNTNKQDRQTDRASLFYLNVGLTKVLLGVAHIRRNLICYCTTNCVGYKNVDQSRSNSFLVSITFHYYFTSNQRASQSLHLFRTLQDWIGIRLKSSSLKKAFSYQFFKFIKRLFYLFFLFFGNNLHCTHHNFFNEY